MKFPNLVLLLAGSVLLSGSCTGRVIDDPASGSAGSGQGGDGRTAAGTGGRGAGGSGVIDEPIDPDKGPRGSATAAGLRLARRLTNLEYTHTVRDLLGDDALPAALVSDEARGEHGFTEPPVSVEAQKLLDHAFAIAARAVDKLPDATACATTGGSKACAQAFVRTFGLRAFRRPPTMVEIDGLGAVYDDARSTIGHDHKNAMRVVIAAMLQSSGFLYHWQLGADAPEVDGDVVKLRPYELASRLSYFLWSSMPDPELFDAAANGRLATDAHVAAQVDRMLASPNLGRVVRAFHRDWLDLARVEGVSKDPVLYPKFDEALKRSMLEEAERFIEHVFTKDDARLETLFSAKYSFVNAGLASIYGLSGITGTDLRQATLAADQRAGLLTLPGVIAAETNPAATNPPRAGNMIWTRLLCKEMPPPPAGVTTQFKMDDALTARENFAKLEGAGSCAGCHKTINPLGFAFEQFDPIGTYRTKDREGRAIDASGELTSRAGQVSFTGLVDLGPKLAKTPEMAECVTRQWTRFALGRTEAEADLWSMDSAFAAAFTAKPGDLKQLLRALATSRTFRYRSPEQAEVLR